MTYLKFVMKDGRYGYLSLRQMKFSDIPFFNEVRNSCIKYLHDQNEYSIKETKDWFNRENPLYYILELDNNEIGYFRTKIDDRRLFIGLDIKEKFRGLSISPKAYELLFKFLDKDEYYLYVREDNFVARNLYKKLGFEIISKETVNGIRSILMVKKMNIKSQLPRHK